MKLRNFLIISILFSVSLNITAQNYIILQDAFSQGGGQSKSSVYNLHDLTGQSAVGISTGNSKIESGGLLFYNMGEMNANKKPNQPQQDRIFDNAIYNAFDSQNPGVYVCSLSFFADDEESDNVQYLIQWAVDPSFSRPRADTTNIYTSGTKVTAVIPLETSDPETLYYWRVRALDPGGSGEWGEWSTRRSFTMSMGIEGSYPYWYQIAGPQFEQCSMNNVEVEGDSVVMISPVMKKEEEIFLNRTLREPEVKNREKSIDKLKSTRDSSGTMVSSAICYDDLREEDPSRENWEGAKWTKSSAEDSIGLQIEYKETGAWNLVPDGEIPGNSDGIFDMSSKFCVVDLRGLSPRTYDSLRMKAIFKGYTKGKDPSYPALKMWGLGRLGGITVVDSEDKMPGFYSLSKISPNPVYGEASIFYQIPEVSKVEIALYDIMGRRVNTLLWEEKKPGYYVVKWKGDDENGRVLPVGNYFLRMQAGSYQKTKKVILIR